MTVKLPDTMEYRETEKWALEEARRIARETLAGTGVSACLFGSRATGRARRFSDIDIALEGQGAVPDRIFVELSERMEESRIPYRVDIVDLSFADATLVEEVRRDGLRWTD